TGLGPKHRKGSNRIRSKRRLRPGLQRLLSAFSRCVEQQYSSDSSRRLLEAVGDNLCPGFPSWPASRLRIRCCQYAICGSKESQPTNAINHLAWFWQPGFFQPWLQQADLEIFQNHLDLNAPRAARAYAYETIAQHDATLACWDTKYAYLELRPSQADPIIPTLFANPQHPGYPSGHACASGASAAVMSTLFPNDTQLFTSMASDAGISTFDAGIHTHLDVSDGLKLGTQVGQRIAARASADGAN